MAFGNDEYFDGIWESQPTSSSEFTKESEGDGQSRNRRPTNNPPQNPKPPKNLNEVLSYVEEVFDRRIALVTEAVLSTKATLLLDGVKSCSGIAVVGPSGAGKTTSLDFLKGTEYDGESLTYWSDDVTPAAFVSHDPSQDEEELAESDLLPKIQHKSLVNPDMAGWFSGSFEQVRAIMAKIARTMDGEGLSRDTGAQGSRKYHGDYRFAVLGATTPLDRRAWNAMGHVGNRLVFHNLPRKEDLDEIADDVFDDEEYGEKVEQCRSEVTDYLNDVWTYYGGYSSVGWPRAAEGHIRDGIAYLANLVAYCRTPMDTSGAREGEHRIMGSLRDIARGHALLCDRRELQLGDLDVCCRIALSTMHKERRGIVRAVVDPDTPNPISSSDIEAHEATSVTRKTIRDRMELLEKLGLGSVVEGDTGRNTRLFELDDDFVWPPYLRYTTFR